MLVKKNIGFVPKSGIEKNSGHRVGAALSCFPGIPELNRSLLEYPNSRPEGTEDFFYRGKVNFGLKPTIRLNHGVVYRASSLEHRVYVLVIKQLYATHYFQTALITVKASRQAGLTGLKGGVIRKVAVNQDSLVTGTGAE